MRNATPDWLSDCESSLRLLSERAVSADAQATWPAESWQALTRTGALRWNVPKSLGGDELEYRQLLEGYAELASRCLTTCFLLSQRDAACRRLRDSDNRKWGEALLPPLAEGSTFATVGLSQLTTSRRHGERAMTVAATPNGLVLNGTMPWVTGAARADHFVTGGVLDDDRQIMVVLPSRTEGLHVEEPMDLMALQGSLTTTVRCDNVRVPSENVLAGPTEKVMAAGRSGPGGLETSCLALGLANGATRHLETVAQSKAEWHAAAVKLRKRHNELWSGLMSLAEEGCSPEQVVNLRADANQFVLHVTQTTLTASKGSGFLLSHPAQLWARQALFFLVWACPRPTVDAMLASFLPCE